MPFADELRKLAELYESGALTREQYDRAVNRTLQDAETAAAAGECPRAATGGEKSPGPMAGQSASESLADSHQLSSDVDPIISSGSPAETVGESSNDAQTKRGEPPPSFGVPEARGLPRAESGEQQEKQTSNLAANEAFTLSRDAHAEPLEGALSLQRSTAKGASATPPASNPSRPMTSVPRGPSPDRPSPRVQAPITARGLCGALLGMVVFALIEFLVEVLLFVSLHVYDGRLIQWLSADIPESLVAAVVTFVVAYMGASAGAAIARFIDWRIDKNTLTFLFAVVQIAMLYYGYKEPEWSAHPWWSTLIITLFAIAGIRKGVGL
jgi:hypothetical protein